MLKRPPQHRVDAPIVYIDQDDDAWDKARIEAEIGAAARAQKAWLDERERAMEAGEEFTLEPPHDAPEGHPVRLYQNGSTRSDLNAPVRWGGEDRLVTEWITGQPTRFILRRLRWDAYMECQALHLHSPVRCYVRACQLGLVDVENMPAVVIDRNRTERSDDEMESLHRQNAVLSVRIGKAALAAAAPL
jgi:hypothetical protein